MSTHRQNKGSKLRVFVTLNGISANPTNIINIKSSSNFQNDVVIQATPKDNDTR